MTFGADTHRVVGRNGRERAADEDSEKRDSDVRGSAERRVGMTG
jgi:hypothetical protein